MKFFCTALLSRGSGQLPIKVHSTVITQQSAGYLEDHPAETLKAMIDSNPGIQSIAGPHDISLLQHVRNGIDANGSSGDAQKLVAYLEGLGNADSRSYLPVADADKQAFLGNYKYGDGERHGFSVRMNMRKLLSFGKLGQSGGALYRIGDNKFTYNGAPSVVIEFQSDGSRIVSLTVTEPGLVIKAAKLSG